MENIKILHFADMHLGAKDSFLGKAAENRKFEALITFENIIELAHKSGVNIIAIAGDLFDSNKIEDRFFEAVFNKIALFPEIKVVFAAGNHDPLSSDSPFLSKSLPSNLYVLGTKDECITFEDLKTKVYGKSFEAVSMQGVNEFSIKPDSAYINIMVIHGELKSDLKSEYNAITPSFVKNSGMDYIALGHVHKRSEIGKINNTYFAYPGCPEGQGFDELDEKGVLIGEIGKGVCNLDFISVSKRKHIAEKIDITKQNQAEEISENILKTLEEKYGDNFRENLYKIELIGETDSETEIILSEIESRLSSLYFVKLRDKTEISLDLDILANEPSLKGIFTKKMLEKISVSSEEEKPILKKALSLGLKAFKAEVKYNEN